MPIEFEVGIEPPVMNTESAKVRDSAKKILQLAEGLLKSTSQLNDNMFNIHNIVVVIRSEAVAILNAKAEKVGHMNLNKDVFPLEALTKRVDAMAGGYHEAAQEKQMPDDPKDTKFFRVGNKNIKEMKPESEIYPGGIDATGLIPIEPIPVTLSRVEIKLDRVLQILKDYGIEREEG